MGFKLLNTIFIDGKRKLVSFNISEGLGHQHDLSTGEAVIYEIGEKTEPIIPGTELFVFNDLEHVRRFILWGNFYSNRYRLFECETGELTYRPYIAGLGCKSWEEAWKHPDRFSYPAPTGTFSTPWIKLTEEIDWIKLTEEIKAKGECNYGPPV